MRIKVLVSGSKGNCTYIETEDHKILLDMGTNLGNIKSKLEDINVSIEDIDTILITHTHTDHIGALLQYTKKYHGNVYMSKIMLGELGYDNLICKYPNLVMYEDTIYLGKTKVIVFKTSHDTKDSKNFIITFEDKSIVYVTDTGYINQKYFDILKNRSVYLFESNYDVEMLLNGKYPLWLKARVAGPTGHLSNVDSAFYLAKLVGNNTKKIILTHLSEENNTPAKALETINNTFLEYNIDFHNISCASQKDGGEEIIL